MRWQSKLWMAWQPSICHGTLARTKFFRSHFSYLKTYIVFLFVSVSVASDSWCEVNESMCEKGIILSVRACRFCFELELALVENFVNSRIFSNGVSQLNSFKCKIDLCMSNWVLLCTFMIESCVSLFETSYLIDWTKILLDDKQKCKLEMLMSPKIGLI